MDVLDEVDSSSSSDESLSSEASPSCTSSDPSSSLNLDKESTEKVSLSHDETKAVNRSKILVYIALVLCATVTGTATYFIAHQAEVQNYEAAVSDDVFSVHDLWVHLSHQQATSILSQFEAYAKDVSAVADSNAEQIFGAAHALGTSFTSQAILMANLTSNSWPNVTLPDFNRRFEEAHNLTGVAYLMYNPLIPDAKLDAWAAYAEENKGWLTQEWKPINETFDPGYISSRVFTFNPEGEIVESDLPLQYPVWQIAPLPTDGFLINMDTHPLGVYNFSQVQNDGVKARHALITGVVNLTGLMSGLASDNKGDQPHSVIFDPIFSDFTNQASVVGFVQAGFPWQYAFMDILPTGTSHRCNFLM